MAQKVARKAAIIGCGNIGAVHSKVLGRLEAEGLAEVIAVGDTDTRKLAELGQMWPAAGQYHDAMELLEHPELELVHICLPTAFHYKYIKAALKKGLHIFVEKPVCLTAAEAEELLVLQEQSQGCLMVGHVVRYMPEYRFLEKAIREKCHGELKSLTMGRIAGRQADWFYDMGKSGSVVLDLQIHDIDFITWLKGKPDSIVPLVRNLEQGIQHSVCMLRYGSCLVQLEAGWAAARELPFQAGYRAVFEAGTIVYDNQNHNSLAVYKEDGSIEYPDVNTGDELCGYESEIRNFILHINGDSDSEIVSLKEAAETLKAALKIRDI